eukprot:jgi/Chrpa1/675/Chrysochromulina_OHIO_Genome00014389-RA
MCSFFTALATISYVPGPPSSTSSTSGTFFSFAISASSFVRSEISLPHSPFPFSTRMKCVWFGSSAELSFEFFFRFTYTTSCSCVTCFSLVEARAPAAVDARAAVAVRGSCGGAADEAAAAVWPPSQPLPAPPLTFGAESSL